MTQPRQTILAVVREDGTDHVRRRAIELARERGAGLILYDADATLSPLEDPLPNAWSAHGDVEQFGNRLSVNDLEAAGRAPLARQVREAQQAGVEAWGWLPENTDADTLRDYAAHEGVATVVVAEGSEIGGDLGSDAGPAIDIVAAE